MIIIRTCRSGIRTKRKPIIGRGLAGARSASPQGRSTPSWPSPGFPSGGLRRGSSGEVVKWLQRGLNKIAGPHGHGVLGGKPLATDGVFGKQTEQVVKAFQAHRGLAADGVVGPKTWAKL